MDLTRRLLLQIAPSLFLPPPARSATPPAPVLHWTLAGTGDSALESQSGVEDPIASRTGHASWVGEGHDRACRLDGYSNWLQHESNEPSLATAHISIAAWLALESYPVDEASLVEILIQKESAFRFAIDKWGFLHLAVRADDQWTTCKSASPMPRAAWTHLSATFTDSVLTLYLNASICGTASISNRPRYLSGATQVLIGKSSDSPMVARVFPTGVLNGLIKDVQIFNQVLPAAEIQRISQASKPTATPDLQRNAPWCAGDPQRPAFHAQPPRAWTNEPHGLIRWGGRYHLFYQKNPNGPYWGHINWGHLTSPDLYRWTETPVALAPEPGPDAEGCWSGSVTDHNGKLALIYTGGDGHRASICLALSSDGLNFNRHPSNPVIAEPPQGMGFPEFRDPYVWREGDGYNLIIGSAVKHVGGTALLYRSTDLVHWQFRKPLLIGDRETSGIFWEMPVFVKVGDYHVLIVCEVPGRASYWVGKWNGETFMPLFTTPHRLELFNHLLSPTPHIDEHGRVIVMGIIPDQRSPKECWTAGYAHLYSLPRVLSVDAKGNLCQTYLDEIDKWTSPLVALSNKALNQTPITIASGTRLKIEVIIKRGGSQSVSLLLRRSPDGQEQTQLRYEWEIGKLVLDRTLSSLNPNVKRDLLETTYFPPIDDSLTLTAFLDESVLEVFLDNRAAFAARLYPTLKTSNELALSCHESGAVAESVKVATVNLA